ncbi:hypothetical protein J6590_024339, partial [Homalodisca vitripennis]
LRPPRCLRYLLCLLCLLHHLHWIPVKHPSATHPPSISHSLTIRLVFENYTQSTKYLKARWRILPDSQKGLSTLRENTHKNHSTESDTRFLQFTDQILQVNRFRVDQNARASRTGLVYSVTYQDSLSRVRVVPKTLRSNISKIRAKL